MAFVVRQIVPTPNPNAMKFMLDREITSSPMSFLTPDSATQHPLANSLFAIPGINSVLLLGDFVTINKSSDAKWPDIKKHVKHILSTTT